LNSLNDIEHVTLISSYLQLLNRELIIVNKSYKVRKKNYYYKTRIRN